MRSALTNAHKHGTAVFDASGDTAGLECKGGEDFSSPPGPNDIGVDAVASLPEMTSVGGTTLSTDMQGRWLAEQAWTDVPMSQGTSGGVATLFARPLFQRAVSAARDSTHRLVPDVAAVADPFTGVRIVYEQQPRLGGGTSQAAPIWAASDGIDEPVCRCARRHGARRSEPASLSGCGGIEPARIPRCESRRQRGRRFHPRI